MSKPRDNIVIATAAEEFHPELPEALVLEDERFVVCPNEDPDVYVCLDWPNAQKIVRNKTKTLQWAKDVRSVIDFYAEDPVPHALTIK